MKGTYQTAFIVPVGTNKILGEDGWEFVSSTRLSKEIKDHLIQSLSLRFLEEYLGIESYVEGDMKMSVIFDDQNEIESIHFQLYGGSLAILSEACKSSRMSSKAELFVPHQAQKS